MSKNLITASLIAVLIAAWLLSGLFTGEPTQQEHPTLAASAQGGGSAAVTGPIRVRAEVRKAERRTRYMVLRGRSEGKQDVEVKAEIAGKIVARPAERGLRVEAGDLLCEVAIDDREAAVAEAAAALQEARIEHEGSLRLKQQGLQSQTAIARTAARLAAATANLERQELNLQRTRIVAPFGGVIEELPMDIGDYAVAGAPCARLIALDPMLLSADVTEAEVYNLNVGDQVVGRTPTGREISGEVTFVGSQSDLVTRTYPVEITVPNPDYKIRSGLTVNVRIGLGEVMAHQLSPALFTLNDAGEIGVRIVGKNDIVEFRPISIIEDGAEGVWVTGLDNTIRLITVGQEFVFDGQEVEPVYASDPSAQLAQP